MSAGKFEFISGSLCLDFVDTLGNRRAEPIERLASPGDLDRWLRAAGLAGAAFTGSTGAHLAQARVLRDAIFRFASSAIENRAISLTDTETINHWALRMPLRPTIVGGHIELTAKQPTEAALSMIAADGIELILGGRRSRIRECPECRMIFVDTSGPGKRRWCSSASGCGNRAKVRAHRSRMSATR
jgi:predicted RNA-binding Zn ribbon-like protein